MNCPYCNSHEVKKRDWTAKEGSQEWRRVVCLMCGRESTMQTDYYDNYYLEPKQECLPPSWTW